MLNNVKVLLMIAAEKIVLIGFLSLTHSAIGDMDEIVDTAAVFGVFGVFENNEASFAI